MTTYAGFINGLRDLALTGVTNLREPPVSMSSEDLPAKWVQLPSATEGSFSFQANGGWPTFKADVVVALVPSAQGTQSQNWTQAVAMLDTLAVALRGADVCRTELSWSIKQTGVTIGDVTYWAILATVEGSG